MRVNCIVLSFLLYTVISCNEGRKPVKIDENIKVHPVAGLAAHQFINWWIGQQKNVPIGLNDQLRNKILNKTDVSELKKYFARNGLNLKVFGDVDDSVRLMEYRSVNRNLITNKVLWIDQNRLRGCRKINKQAMWDCLEQDYGKSDYYYISSPVFSMDGNWALISINYMNKITEKSGGGGRLYKRIKGNIWKEMAFLSYWGNLE